MLAGFSKICKYLNTFSYNKCFFSEIREDFAFAMVFCNMSPLNFAFQFMKPTSIRNFCIIAHIDHGKSTLADRLMEISGTVQIREMEEQKLDSMDLERERGITIKLTPVRMDWKGVELNLIDTPGHVDFQYEVSRSLASVEGAILVVDATQGIEAQTLSNVYLAIENDLEIIPVLNKIDLPSADVERVSEEVINLLGCKKEDIISVSAKTGVNVESVLDAVIERIPEPKKLSRESDLLPHESEDNES